MNAFWGLVKKDLALMQFWYIVWVIISFIGVMAGYVLQKRLDEPSIVIPMMLMFATIHFILMPVMLFQVLWEEGKTQLWLYNPQSSWKLLLAKLTAASILQLLAQLLLAFYGLFFIQVLKEYGQLSKVSDVIPFKQGLIMEGGIYFYALFLSLWVLFLWSIYHSLGKYPSIRNFRWLVVLIIWLGINAIEAFLNFKIFKGDPVLKLEIDVLPNMEYVDPHNGWMVSYSEVPFPLLTMILYCFYATAMFFIASWLLDKKVEV